MLDSAGVLQGMRGGPARERRDLEVWMSETASPRAAAASFASFPSSPGVALDIFAAHGLGFFGCSPWLRGLVRSSYRERASACESLSVESSQGAQRCDGETTEQGRWSRVMDARRRGSANLALR